MKTLLRIILGAAMLAIGASAVHAQTPRNGAIESRLEARKVVRAANGSESFAAADTARPGDVIEYVATYRNTTTQPVRNLEATLPIPANTVLVAGIGHLASAKASIDSATFAAMPLKRKVKRDGREIEEPVPLGEYRYLRWYPGELGAGMSVAFRARVRVVDERSASASGNSGK